MNYDMELDEEFDSIIESIHSLNQLFEELKEPDLFALFHVSQNTILSTMDQSKYKQFCKQEFKTIRLWLTRHNLQKEQ